MLNPTKAIKGFKLEVEFKVRQITNKYSKTAPRNQQEQQH
jgi:hypothetical protein